MDLLRLRTVQWITILGSIGTILSLIALWKSPYRTPTIALTLAFTVVTVFLELQAGRINVFFSGIRNYHRTFPVSRNAEIFATVTKSYTYFGVSFASVLNSFRVWYSSSDRRANASIRIFLLDPEASDVLEFQARYERNLWGDQLTAAQRRSVDDTVKRTRDSIALVLDTLATLPPSSPAIEVYFHREKVRKWLHLVNDDRIYAGMLRLGDDGLQAPVLELGRESGKWRLFDYYQDEMESIYRNAVAVKLPG